MIACEQELMTLFDSDESKKLFRDLIVKVFGDDYVSMRDFMNYAVMCSNIEIRNMEILWNYEDGNPIILYTFIKVNGDHARIYDERSRDQSTNPIRSAFIKRLMEYVTPCGDNLLRLFNTDESKWLFHEAIFKKFGDDYRSMCDFMNDQVMHINMQLKNIEMLWNYENNYPIVVYDFIDNKKKFKANNKNKVSSDSTRLSIIPFISARFMSEIKKLC